MVSPALYSLMRETAAILFSPSQFAKVATFSNSCFFFLLQPLKSQLSAGWFVYQAFRVDSQIILYYHFYGRSKFMLLGFSRYEVWRGACMLNECELSRLL